MREKTRRGTERSAPAHRRGADGQAGKAEEERGKRLRCRRGGGSEVAAWRFPAPRRVPPNKAARPVDVTWPLAVPCRAKAAGLRIQVSVPFVPFQTKPPGLRCGEEEISACSEQGPWLSGLLA